MGMNRGISGMTHDEAFLQAIREAPNDDTPRRIYADWLEENRRADRAEFIRLQCRLASMPDSSTDRPALMDRAEELLRRHWEEWVGPLRAIVGPRRDRYGESWLGEKPPADAARHFVRGFVNGTSLDAESFVRHARDLRYLIPQFDWLHLWGAGRCARALAGVAELEGLSTLAFTDYYDAPLRAGDAFALAASLYLYDLSTLVLSYNSLGDEGAEALAQAPWLVRVTWLDLTDNGLSDRGVHALAQSPYLVNLQTLHLQRNYLTSDGIAALTGSPYLRRLRRLEHVPVAENIPMDGSAPA